MNIDLYTDSLSFNLKILQAIMSLVDSALVLALRLDLFPNPSFHKTQPSYAPGLQDSKNPITLMC